MVRGKPVSEDIRNLIIKKYKVGKSYNEIALELNLKKSTVQSLIKYNIKNLTVESQVNKRGRKSKITERDVRALSKISVQSRRDSIRNLSLKWSEAIGKPVGREWTRQNLRKLGYKYYTAKQKPLLNTLQKRKRLAWAKDKKDWVKRQWDSIIFSDESKFDVCVGDKRTKVLRKKDQAFHRDCLRRTVKFPVGVMVWGCISSKGVGKLHFVNGTLKAQDYIQVLESALIPSIQMFRMKETIFQQDSAPPHTAKVTKQWLSTQEIAVLDWPSSSPDLSPIESVWCLMKRRLRNDPARTLPELKAKIEEIWNSITSSECEQLFSTMPERCKAVIEAKGDVTKY